MINLKFTVERLKSTLPLLDYIARINAEFDNNLNVSGHTVCCYYAEAKAVLERVLDDYSTLGYEVIEEFDIFDLTAFCDDAELNNWFVNQRMNIMHGHLDAVGELMIESDVNSKQAKEKIDFIDGMNEYNGIYKMRNIIYAIADTLAKNEIYVGEAINGVVKETLN